MADLRLIDTAPMIKTYREGVEARQQERLRDENLRRSQQLYDVTEEQRAPNLRNINSTADFNTSRARVQMGSEGAQIEQAGFERDKARDDAELSRLGLKNYYFLKSYDMLKEGNIEGAKWFAQQNGAEIPEPILRHAQNGRLKGDLEALQAIAEKKYPNRPDDQTAWMGQQMAGMTSVLGEFQFDPAKAYQQPPGAPKPPAVSSTTAAGTNAPSGYRYTTTGNLEFIPGGPADPSQKQRPERPLPSSAINTLGEIGGQSQSLERLGGGFQDRYGGNVLLGESANTIGRYFGDSTGQTQWWQDYQNIKNEVRNRLFGSALTATERDEFDKAQIDPRMNADQIRANLARQQALAQQAARKLARAYLASGYSREAIEGALGIPLESLEQPREVPGYAPPAGAQPNAQPVRVQTPEEAMQLAPGTRFVTPDGRVKVR